MRAGFNWSALRGREAVPVAPGRQQAWSIKSTGSVLVLSMVLASLLTAVVESSPIVPTVSGTSSRNHLGGQVIGRLRLRPADGLAGTSALLSESAVWLSAADSYLPAFACPGAGTGVHSFVASVANTAAESGFDALLVGDAVQGNGRGRVWVYFGGAEFDSVPEFVLTGVRAGDLFGAAVAGVGDIDGDGYGDFAVGAPGASNGAGKAYVYLGGPAASSTPALILSGAQAGDLFGTALSAAGALDASGEPEFLVGAPGAFGGGGAVYVFQGGSAMSSTPLAVLSGDAPRTYGERPRFGASLAGGPDFDRDQRADFAVGAPGRSGERGRAYLFAGGEALPTVPSRTYAGTEAFAHLGASLALDSLFSRLGADLVIGSPGADGGRGRADAYWGSLGPEAPALAEVGGSFPDDRFGSSLSIVPSAPGDLYGSVLSGAFLADSPLANGGAAYLVAMRPIVGVEASSVVALADGATMAQGMYVSTRPRLVLALASAVEVDPVASSVSLDGVVVPITEAARAAAGDPAGIPGGLMLSPELDEGPHTLRAELVSRTGGQRGTTEFHFTAAAKLRLVATTLWPNPSHGRLQVSFALTRPADFEFAVFDVQGRRVYSRPVTRGVAATNQFSWDASVLPSQPGSGVYFYVLTARHQRERDEVRGRIVLFR